MAEENNGGKGLLYTVMIAVLAGGGSGFGSSAIKANDVDKSVGVDIRLLTKEIQDQKQLINEMAVDIKFIKMRISDIESGRSKKVQIKEGVKVGGLQPEIVLAIGVANEVWRDNGRRLVVTRGVEPPDDKNYHRPSRHYLGFAADLRTRYFDKADIPRVAAILRSRLGDQYSVVVESDHIHMEFRPV